MSFLHLEDSYRGNRLKQVLLVFLFETEVNKTERPLFGSGLISVGGGFRLLAQCPHPIKRRRIAAHSKLGKTTVNKKVLASRPQKTGFRFRSEGDPSHLIPSHYVLRDFHAHSQSTR